MTTDTTPLLSREEIEVVRKHGAGTITFPKLCNTASAAYDPTGKLWSDRARKAEENYERAADAYYTKDSELASAEMRIAGLEKALEVAETAIGDWCAQYAPSETSEERLAAAQQRIHRRGTLAYIAEVSGVIRAALAKEQSRG